MSAATPPPLSRRAALLGLAGTIGLGRGALAFAAPASAPLRDEADDRRLVVVLLRGAMDGMAAVVPYGDGALAGLRGALLPTAPVGTPGGLLDCGGFFGLHPSLQTLGALFRAGELLPIHAVAGHDRSRSHFEAQDCLESGADQRLASGWLNRAVAVRPGPRRPDEALSLEIDPPLLLRGPAPVGAWAPPRRDAPDDAFLRRVIARNASSAPIAAALRQCLADRDFARRVLGDGAPAERSGFVRLADAAGRLLGADRGPRVAALELTGWDTHQNQNRALGATLAELDRGLAALQAGLGDAAWRRTAVLVVTEFGRTARVNGTGGTDHGTGTVAFLAGGAVAGGRVLADWPGLGPGPLFENRDLAPTRDLRAVIKAVLARPLGLSADTLDRVFPGSGSIRAETRLFRI